MGVISLKKTGEATTGFLRHFDRCNDRDMSKFVPFYIGTKQYGWVKRKLAGQLGQEVEHFTPFRDGLALSRELTTFAARSDALADATEWIVENRDRELRNEMYPILDKWGDEPLAQLDRAAVPWFGVRAYGIHVNGFVRLREGIHLWIGERATDRMVEPGKLDNMIGGGQPIGLTLEENLKKEGKEEAGLSATQMRGAKHVSTVSYMLEKAKGLRNDVLFVYDLELPVDVTPRNTDGEVARFELMPLEKVAALVRDTDRFKFNCNLVVIDFLARHGFLTDKHPEYRQLKKRLAEAGDQG